MPPHRFGSTSPGILPIPNSPIIKNNDPANYIKCSNYPIPYQATIAVEGTNIHDISSWDISITNQNVKVKFEWSILDDPKQSTVNIFPKAVLNSISQYNLTLPTWSISYSSKKLSLKCEWKYASNNPQTNTTSQPYTPITPNTRSPKSFYKSPNDSGYMSSTANSFLNSSTPYLSPHHNKTPKHDIYRPPFKQPVFPPYTPNNSTPPITTPDTPGQHNPPPVLPIHPSTCPPTQEPPKTQEPPLTHQSSSSND